MTLEFEVDFGYLTDDGIKDMPTWVKLNDEDGEHTSTTYVNINDYWHVVDENAKLREEIEAAKHDLSLFSSVLVASKFENAKLRELCKRALRNCYDAYEQVWGWDDDWVILCDEARELGIEVTE